MAEKPQPNSEIVLYQTEDGRTRIECRFEHENVWMTQALMAELFQTTPQNITLHLKAIYEEGELAEAATCKNYLQVQTEGKRQVQRQLRHYNLEAILTDAGRVEKAVADRLALDEYEKFHARRLAAESEADERAFEETVKKLKPLPPGKKPKKS